jgi:hypothetical protein
MLRYNYYNFSIFEFYLFQLCLINMLRINNLSIFRIWIQYNFDVLKSYLSIIMR